MATFELIPCRLYLSQSKTWMHKIKAEIKIYILLLLWISIFILSYYKLLIIALSLIITSCTIKSNKCIIKKHLAQTLGMTILTMLFSFGVALNYKYYLQQEQRRFTKYSYNQECGIHLRNKNKQQHLFVIKPAVYLFITVYSMKLVMITTSPEILAITVYKTKIINKFFNNELLFIFLLSLHIINNIIIKLEKIIQAISLRGNLNLYQHSTRLFLLFFLVSKVFFREVTRESIEISQALYTRNLNKENNNFLKIYKADFTTNDYLGSIIGTAYLVIVLLV